MNLFLLSRQAKTLFCCAMGLIAIATPVKFSLAEVLAQNSTATIYAPPSNVRATPNGQIICSIKTVTVINTYDYQGGWYQTDICGTNGYIHESQLRFSQSNYPSDIDSTKCSVINIRTGQLALRQAPAGESIAGLDNNNVVEYLQGEMPWFYVRVLNGPNSRVNGKTGWVNANYLDCY